MWTAGIEYFWISGFVSCRALYHSRRYATVRRAPGAELLKGKDNFEGV